MDFEILAYALPAAFVWLMLFRISARSSLGLASPIALYALGLIIFYIIPPIYWQFRPWTYAIPSYFEGLPRVFLGQIILSLPFLALVLFFREDSSSSYGVRSRLSCHEYGILGVWIFALLVALGLLWRINLLNYGFQARLQQSNPSLFGSESLAFLVGNIGYYYPAGYFALFALGNKMQSRIGLGLWAFDGLFNLFLLQRYSLLIFILRSVLFLAVLGYRFSNRAKIFLGICLLLTISIIGQTHELANERSRSAEHYIGPSEVFRILRDSTLNFISGDTQAGVSSTEGGASIRLLDDTMFRLYDARSASAVMYAMPEQMPFLYGETFLQVMYALIPRYFWSEKPDLRDVHLITTWFMPKDIGINPLGTLAEFYVNFGFWGILGGGVVSALLCRWISRSLQPRGVLFGAWVCVYPIFAELLINANDSFTKRMCEGVRGIVFLLLLGFMLFVFRKPRQQTLNPTATYGSAIYPARMSEKNISHVG